MGRLSTVVVRACNLRTAALMLALWLLLSTNPPAWLEEFASRIDRSVFRSGLYLSELPVPRTFITVIHVPDIEYERWLADLPGASGLQKLLQMVEQRSGATKPMVGVVLEQPLALIQPEAESILSEIQGSRAASAALYQQTEELLQRREYLTQQLQSQHVVLGLLNHVPGRYRPLSTDLGELEELPVWLLPWIQPSPPWVSANTTNPVLHYLPIPIHHQAKQYLALQDQSRYLPTFWAQFLAASERQLAEAIAPDLAAGQLMFWHQDGGLAFDRSSVALGPDAGFVPIYGEMSGIRASLRQLSLEAALANGDLGRWILIGRDGDERLNQAAQILAALGDGAILAEPWWWPAIQRLALIASALVLCIFIPLLHWRLALSVLITLLGALMLAQVLGQALWAFWLPSGLLVCYGVAAFALLWVWRWQEALYRAVVGRADEASLALAQRLREEGNLHQAYELAASCRTGQPVLEQIYQISLAYESKGQFALALQALREVRRRQRKYKDVPQRIQRIRRLAISQTMPAETVIPSLSSK